MRKALTLAATTLALFSGTAYADFTVADRVVADEKAVFATVESLDVVPARGEAATFCGLKLTAQAADERRVRELLVEAVK